MHIGFDFEESQNLAIIAILMSLISLISLGFTLYCYLKYKELQNTQFSQVSRILMGDVLYTCIIFIIAVAYLGLEDDPNTLVNSNYSLCQIEAYLSVFSVLMSVAWTSIICHTLYQQVIKEEYRTNHLYYIIIGYLIPAIISFIPFFFNAYGITYPWPQTNCFFNSNFSFTEFDIFQTTCYYIPIWIAFIYNSIIIYIVIKKMETLLQQQNLSNINSIYGLFAYPAILGVCWVIPGIVDLFEVLSSGWMYTNIIICNSIGLCDSILYCFTEIFTLLKFDGFRLVYRNPDPQIQTELCETRKDQVKIA